MSTYEAPRLTHISSCAGIGKLLRQRRKELAITQTAIATALKMSPRLIGDMEHGKEGVAISKYLRYANFIGIDFVLTVRGK